jgi:hypothetical protein
MGTPLSRSTAGRFATTVAAIALLGPSATQAQSPTSSQPTRPREFTSTTITVELVTGTEGIGLAAQQWQQVFAKLQIPLQVRRAIRDEKPEVKERTFGTLREVTVIGQLDRSGKIIVPGRSFTQADAPKLAEWIDELKTFGAKGSPENKPLWGLDKEQFGTIYSALSEPVKIEVAGKSFEAALLAMELPPKYPVRLSTATADWLRSEFEQLPPVRSAVKGLSQGTALAIVLNEYGLGFRPWRTPSGSVELAVEPLTKTTDVWPIGWPLEPLQQRKLAPKMFEFIPVELEDVKLLDVFDAVSVKTEVSIYVDHYRIEAKQIDLANLRVSHPSRQTTWGLLLKRVTNPAKLTHALWMDEAGRPFIWVTTLEARPRQP